ncbi:MAG: AI-2E family transporter [Chloroflexota bacterium]
MQRLRRGDDRERPAQARDAAAGPAANLPRGFRRWLYALVVVLTLLGSIYLVRWFIDLLHSAGNLVAIFFFAWLLQFFLTPAVDQLQRLGLSRLWAVSLLYAVLGLALGALVVVAAPAAYIQGARLVSALTKPATYAPITNATIEIERLLVQHFHVPKAQISAFTRDYSVNLQHGAIKAGTQLQRLLNSQFTSGAVSGNVKSFLGFLGALNTALLDFVIVLILAFYMTLDGHRLMREVLAYFPPATSEVLNNVRGIVNRKFGGYVRGQLTLAALYGVLTFLVVIFFGVPYPVVVAAIAAVMMLVPFIGTFLAIIPALLGFMLAHATDPSFPWPGLVILLLLLAAVQHVVINVMAPRVMGGAMGMHPLTVLVGLLLGAAVAGLWGAIFGAPVFGVALDLADLIYQRLRARWDGKPPTGDAEGTTTAPKEETGPAPPAGGGEIQQG